MAENKTLMHILEIRPFRQSKKHLFLRHTSHHQFTWFIEDEATDVVADTIEEAIFLANRKWKNDGVSSINCGYVYDLPERDEHGRPALFYQLVQSRASASGIFYDEFQGNNRQLRFASDQAIECYKKLKACGHL